ncbi:MAG: fumarylacetoacetate hydrolase family protein [Bryobacterales bacterium]|nr:fumarylacetoacetate hydrolase family protein [Bryobacterales bacterium]MBV9398980.1 fumarylacetoacetate hydrolase family protein [Bryobacterales bacterium]
MTQFVRYSANSQIHYGILEGERIHELQGDLFSYTASGVERNLSDLRLLAPCAPRQILAVGRNYKTHLSGPVKLPEPTRPEIFFKPISSLQDPEGPIIVPPDSSDLHFEGELVLIIGSRLKNAGKDEADAAIFGVTCGNDVSERNWQRGPDKDVQWWRAKGSDTFSPFGPVIVTGLDYGNLRLTTRLNGETVQDQRTSDLIFDCPTMVSFISRYITLEPGDVIYTGTPGQTRPMRPGDMVEVEIEGIGVLRNPVTMDDEKKAG